MLIFSLPFRKSSIPLTMLCGLIACSQPDQAIELTGNTMGTRYSIQVTDCDVVDCDLVKPLIEERLTELNKHLSHWDPESELSKLNRSPAADWQIISSDLGNVIRFAVDINEQTMGAFDITVGQAVNTWGFGPQQQQAAPDADAIRIARSHSGQHKLDYREQPQAIRKLDPAVQLDLSALAKGYAVDQLSFILDTLGSANYLVEIGGELRASGRRADGKLWRIGIEQPDGQSNGPINRPIDIEYIVVPGETAIATSGDYRNYYMLAGQRISHTINPANAQPIRHALAAVSVISASTMQADAWATALMVMGPEKGPVVAREKGIAALFLVRSKQEKRAIISPAFQPYLENAQ